MRMLNYITCAVCAFLIVSSAQAQTIDAGRGELPIAVPAGYSADSPAPLVVLLHGYTSSGKGQSAYMKFGDLVDKYGFLFVAPDGTVEESGRKVRFWNATDACCNMYGSAVDDSTYLSNLIAEVKKQYSVDERQVYLVGHSNGGFMSHRMAMDHPETIAAIASLAGAAPSELIGAKPDSPVSILQIHGTKDSVIRYEGGDINAVQYPSAVETVEKWAAFNAGTKESKTPKKKLDLDKRLDGDETTILEYDRANVELWTINDGSNIPSLSDQFCTSVIEWLLAHPKAAK